MRGNPFEDFIEDELDIEALDGETQTELMRQRQEAMKDLLDCLEQLKALFDGYSPYGRIPPKDRRD